MSGEGITTNKNVLGIELQYQPEEISFSSTGLRSATYDRGQQQFTIISFYQYFEETNSSTPDTAFTDIKNVFFSINRSNFSYVKLKYWIAREDYSHPSAQPNTVYYFVEECIFNEPISGNPINVAVGWDSWISSNTINASNINTNIALYPPLDINLLSNP